MDLQIKEEERRREQRMDRAKMDAFNLGISDGVKLKMKERPKTCDVSVSVKKFIYITL